MISRVSTSWRISESVWRASWDNESWRFTDWLEPRLPGTTGRQGAGTQGFCRVEVAIPLAPCLREDMSNKPVPCRVTPHRKPNKERIGNGYALRFALFAGVLILGPGGHSDGLQDVVGFGREPDIWTIS